MMVLCNIFGKAPLNHLTGAFTEFEHLFGKFVNCGALFEKVANFNPSKPD